jgi:hypothetical protein
MNKGYFFLGISPPYYIDSARIIHEAGGLSAERGFCQKGLNPSYAHRRVKREF